MPLTVLRPPNKTEPIRTLGNSKWALAGRICSHLAAIILGVPAALFSFQVHANSFAPSRLHDKAYWSSFDWSKFTETDLMKKIPNVANPERSKDGSLLWIKERDLVGGNIQASDRIQLITKNGVQRYRYLVTIVVEDKKKKPFLCKQTHDEMKVTCLSA